MRVVVCRVLLLTSIVAGRVLAVETPPARPAEKPEQATATLTWLSSGVGQRLGLPQGQAVALSRTRPPTLTGEPAELDGPLYGALRLGGTNYPVIVDGPADDRRLRIDAGADGSLADTSPVGLTEHYVPNGPDRVNQAGWYGRVAVWLKAGARSLPAVLAVYLTRGGQVGAPEGNLIAFADYAFQGQVEVNQRQFAAMVVDPNTGGNLLDLGQLDLLVDVNGNGRFDSQGERFSLGRPFVLANKAWQVDAFDPATGQLSLVETKADVKAVPVPPVVALGRRAIPFQATALDGTALDFPKTRHPKLLLLSFWATWSGPARAEVPFLAAAYQAHHGQGLDIVSVSLDRPEQADAIKDFARKHDMAWPQVYDGGFWKAGLAQLYGVTSVPWPVLVDGSTGAILAMGDELRGEQLAATLDRVLAPRPMP